jgi:hypothetical protein
MKDPLIFDVTLKRMLVALLKMVEMVDFSFEVAGVY